MKSYPVGLPLSNTYWQPLLAVFLCGLLTSCSDSVQIGQGQYGVKTRAGEVKDIVLGPATVEKSFFIEHVTVYAKNEEIRVILSGREPLTLSIEIVDPAQFHSAFASSFDHLLRFCGEQLAGGKTPQDLIDFLNTAEMGLIADARP